MDKDQTAEVMTPAEVVVWTICPLCDIAQPITMTIGSQLNVDGSGRSLKLQAKAKAVSHRCGQLTLAVVDGQEALALDDEAANGEPALDGETVFDDSDAPVVAPLDETPGGVRNLLTRINEQVPLAEIKKWSEGDLVQVASYAEAIQMRKEGEDVDVPPRPAILGKLPGLEKDGREALLG